jgi:hypothetical protein
MFKNAPPPRAKPLTTIEDISGAEEEKPENKSSKKVKTEIAHKLGSLDKYKLGGSKTVDTSLAEPEFKNTQFGISNTDNAVKVNKNKGLVELMKACLAKERILSLTKIL